MNLELKYITCLNMKDIKSVVIIKINVNLTFMQIMAIQNY